MAKTSIKLFAFIATAVILNSCGTQTPIGYQTRIGIDGKQIREASWHDGARQYVVRIKKDSITENNLENEQPKQPRIEDIVKDKPLYQPIPKTTNLRGTFGNWVIDIEASLKANSGLSNEVLASLKKNLEENPFDLEISNGLYISRSKIKTFMDKYKLQTIQRNTVFIKLISPYKGDSRDGDLISLRVKDGKLWIGPIKSLVFVMKKQSKIDSKVKNQESQKQLLESKKEPGIHIVTTDDEEFLKNLKKANIKLWGLKNGRGYHYVEDISSLKKGLLSVAKKLRDEEVSDPFEFNNKYWIIQKIGRKNN